MRFRTFVGSVGIQCLIGSSILFCAAAQEHPETLTLGTASPGGVYYVYGEGVARLLTDKLGIPVNALPTQGPVHNVRLVESKGLQIGLTTMGVAFQGWTGEGAWTGGKRHRNIRALFPMYDTAFHFVSLRRSAITAIDPVRKIRIGVGPRAGTGGTYASGILQALGISAQIQYGSFADMANDLVAGRHDLLLAAGGIPFPAVREAEAKEPLNFLSLSPEQRSLLQKKFPELSLSELPVSSYESLKQSYVTIGVYNFAIGRIDLPETLAYALVKAVNEGQPQLVKVHSAARETLAMNVNKNTFLPFHPGAVRYYREIGINIPEALAIQN